MVRFSHLGRAADAAFSMRVAMSERPTRGAGVLLPTRGKVLGPVPKAVYAWGERYG